jgi:hypothetical protein
LWDQNNFIKSKTNYKSPFLIDSMLKVEIKKKKLNSWDKDNSTKKEVEKHSEVQFLNNSSQPGLIY